MPELPHWSEYVQPSLMVIGSGANLIAGFIGIYLGGHLIRQDDPTQPATINPMFIVAATTSGFYCAANVFALGKITQRRTATWVEREEWRRQDKELGSVRIDR